VQAGVSAVTLTSSINLTTQTSSPKVNSAVAVNFGATTLAAASVGDTAPYVGVLTAFPSGGYVAVTAAATFAILDMYTPQVSTAARLGTGFGIGSKFAGIRV
jgi:hypothetical protein